MATFNKHYTTSELLNLLDRGSLIHYYWTKCVGLYTFYFLDSRRCPKLQENGTYCFVSHKANYYRLRNKINHLPFRLILDPRSKVDSCKCYLYTIVPDSSFIYDCAGFKLKELNERFGGKLVVNVEVI